LERREHTLPGYFPPRGSPSRSASVRRFLYRGFESAHEICEFDADGVANLFQFEKIQSARTRLILADEGLRATDRVGNVGLVESFFFSNRAEKGQKQFLFTSVCPTKRAAPRYSHEPAA
jgi:hypothetical protein